MQPVLPCSNAATLAFVLEKAGVSVVHRGPYAIASYFPEAVHEMLAAQRPSVKLVVASFEAAYEFRLPLEPTELGVFAGRELVGKLDPLAPRGELYLRLVDRRRGEAHRAQLSRTVLDLIDRAAARVPAASPGVHGDPFAILDLSSAQATLAEVEAARKRLALELHPDRVQAAKLGPRLERLAEAELKRVNGAVDTIRRLRGSVRR